MSKGIGILAIAASSTLAGASMRPGGRTSDGCPESRIQLLKLSNYVRMMQVNSRYLSLLFKEIVNG